MFKNKFLWSVVAIAALAGQQATVAAKAAQAAKAKPTILGMNEMSWGELFLCLLAFNTVVFVISFFIMDDLSIVDITWPLMFLIPNAFLLAKRCTFTGKSTCADVSVQQWLMFGLVATWSLRLSLHLFLRHKGEDWRYQMLFKNRWASCPYAVQALLAYVTVFVLQGAFAMVNNGSAIYVMRNSPAKQGLDAWMVAGVIVWVVAELIEMVADQQLQAHRDDPEMSGVLLKTGLWRYSRHPNYFGECLSWWGIYLIACGGATGAAGGWKTFYAPLFISLLIPFVSGIRILEQYRQKNKAVFRVYMEETSAFIPWFATPIEGPELEERLKYHQAQIDEEQAARDAAKSGDDDFNKIN